MTKEERIQALVAKFRSRFTPLEQAQMAGDLVDCGPEAMAQLTSIFSVEFGKYHAERKRVAQLKGGSET